MDTLQRRPEDDPRPGGGLRDNAAVGVERQTDGSPLNSGHEKSIENVQMKKVAGK